MTEHRQSGNNIPDIRLMSLNVRGLNREVKRKSVFQYVRKRNIDICFLQETYGSEANESLWANQWGGQMVSAHGTNHSGE